MSECTAKRKAWRDNLYAPMRKALVAGYASLLLSHPPMPTPSSRPGSPTLSPSRPSVPGLLSCSPVPGLLSRPPMPGLLSSPPVPGSLSPPVPTLSSLPMPAPSSPFVPAPSSPPVPALLSRSVLGPAPIRLTSSALRTFKQALSDQPLGRQSTSPSPAKPLCPFSTLGPLSEKSDCKRPFDTTFINSRLLSGNHVAKEVDLSFGECGCLAPVKLNRSWQLELLDRKPVCIMEAIPLTAALFWDPLFAPCPCHTMKLASKLELKTQGIASGVVKERIEAV